jgi:hypothetical protein
MTLELSSFTNPMEKVKFLKKKTGVPFKTSNRTLALPTVLKEKEIHHGSPNLGTFQSTVGTVSGTSNVPVMYRYRI